MSAPLSPSKQQVLEMLRRVYCFASFTDEQLRVLVDLGYRRSLAPDDIVCHEGDTGQSLYVVLSGEVEVISSRAEKPIAALRAGQFFGEISLLAGLPRTATVRAKTDTKVFVLHRDNLWRLLREHVDLAAHLVQALWERHSVLVRMGILGGESEAVEAGAVPSHDRIKQHVMQWLGLYSTS